MKNQAKQYFQKHNCNLKHNSKSKNMMKKKQKTQQQMKTFNNKTKTTPNLTTQQHISKTKNITRNSETQQQTQKHDRATKITTKIKNIWHFSNWENYCLLNITCLINNENVTFSTFCFDVMFLNILLLFFSFAIAFFGLLMCLSFFLRCSLDAKMHAWTHRSNWK